MVVKSRGAAARRTNGAVATQPVVAVDRHLARASKGGRRKGDRADVRSGVILLLLFLGGITFCVTNIVISTRLHDAGSARRRGDRGALGNVASAPAPAVRGKGRHNATDGLGSNGGEGRSVLYEESILVLTTVRISTAEGIQSIRRDYDSLCRFHRECVWEIDAQVPDSSMMSTIQNLVSGENFPPDVHFHWTSYIDEINPYSIVKDFADEMVNYDLVLIKDGNVRTVDFPWQLFIERKENSVISGPLLQSANGGAIALTRSSEHDYPMHIARNWNATSWSKEIYASITPLEVPILERTFVLLDGNFASDFFDLILTPEYVNGDISYGLDMLWCQAAKEWDSSRPGCYLIPVVASNVEGHPAVQNMGMKGGEIDIKATQNDELVRDWLQVSMAWHDIIHEATFPQIEQRCRALLGINPEDHFDLQTCSMKLIFSFAHYHYVPTPGGSSISNTGGNALGKTGSWSSCSPPRETFGQGKEKPSTRWLNHPDSAQTTISCTRIHYRIPNQSLNNIQQARESIVFGVLSGASGDGPTRRQSIRSTWSAGQRNVFFIVAGPWNQVKDEYGSYGDLLWLDMDEIYLTEISHLTFKTEAFLSILYERLVVKSDSVRYLFKTDDDSYVALDKLKYELLGRRKDGPGVDYWGKCKEGAKPHRNQVVPWQKKWYIPYEVYRESVYPTYCMGAGYALSRAFLDCAFGKGHAAQIHYMPNEDVAVGMLAERCSVQCTNDNRVWIRYNVAHDGINMNQRIVQHYVKNGEEMRTFHSSVERNKR